MRPGTAPPRVQPQPPPTSPKALRGRKHSEAKIITGFNSGHSVRYSSSANGKSGGGRHTKVFPRCDYPSRRPLCPQSHTAQLAESAEGRRKREARAGSPLDRHRQESSRARTHSLKAPKVRLSSRSSRRKLVPAALLLLDGRSEVGRFRSAPRAGRRQARGVLHYRCRSPRPEVQQKRTALQDLQEDPGWTLRL